jgi:hypothetical protein
MSKGSPPSLLSTLAGPIPGTTFSLSLVAPSQSVPTTANTVSIARAVNS